MDYGSQYVMNSQLVKAVILEITSEQKIRELALFKNTLSNHNS